MVGAMNTRRRQVRNRIRMNRARRSRQRMTLARFLVLLGYTLSPDAKYRLSVFERAGLLEPGRRRHVLGSGLLAAAVVLAFAFASASAHVAHADPQPALDRQLVERLVLAEESQAHQLEALTRAVERCGR